MGKQYSAPPLVEALLEIKWKLLQIDSQTLLDPSYPLLTGIIYERVKENFPFIEKLSASDIPDGISPYIVKVRFRKAENSWPLIQVGPGIAVLNFVKDYVWSSFNESAKKFYATIYGSYLKTSNQGPPVIESITLRYINRVDKDSSDTLLDFLKTNLHIELNLPASILTCPESTEELNGIILNVDCLLANPKAKGSIRVRSLNENNTQSFIWDIVIHSTSNECDPIQTQEGFDGWISQAHQVAENWFNALIEGNLEKKFGVVEK